MMDSSNVEVTIDGLDLVDVIDFIGRKKNKFVSITLSDIEDELSDDSVAYRQVRKIILDGFNDYTRSLLRVLFGDVEGLTMR